MIGWILKYLKWVSGYYPKEVLGDINRNTNRQKDIVKLMCQECKYSVYNFNFTRKQNLY